ncbi:MAG: hypothetical protein R2752_04255 [Vicinamibacterales bacterium]
MQAGPVTPDATVPTAWSRFGDGDDPAIVAAGTWLRGACRDK